MLTHEKKRAHYEKKRARGSARKARKVYGDTKNPKRMVVPFSLIPFYRVKMRTYANETGRVAKAAAFLGLLKARKGAMKKGGN